MHLMDGFDSFHLDTLNIQASILNFHNSLEKDPFLKINFKKIIDDHWRSSIGFGVQENEHVAFCSSNGIIDAIDWDTPTFIHE